MKKMYCLVVTDDYCRFSFVFFLATKDETSEILKIFTTGIENLIDLKVKVIRCDNGTEFKNKVMNQFCEMKDIKREFSVAKTPQQNGVAERKNRTLIEAARTMLVDSKLPTTFWAEAVNAACYVQNRVLVIKPHNKTPYELFLGRKPVLSFMRPFRCPVTILNTLDHLGKFDGKADEGFFIGYSTNSKAYKLFDIDDLTISMNYKPVVAGNQSNGNVGTKENIDAGQDQKKIVPDQKYILLPLLTSDLSLSKSSKDSPDAEFKPSGEEEKIDSEHQENEDSEVPNTEEPRVNQEQVANVNNTNNINNVSPTVSAADIENNVVDENIVYGCIDDPNMPNLEEIVYSDDDDEEVGAEADINNLATNVPVYRNKKDDKGIVVRNKARLVAQGYTQEEGINYDEVFAPVARLEAIRLFLAYASFMGFIVYQMDVKSAFLYGTIEEEVYVCQPPSFEDPQFPDKVYKVEKALYGLHQAPRAWYETLFTYLLENGFRRGTIDNTLFIKKDKGLQLKQKDDGIFISQDKYVADILKKFDFATMKTTCTPIETNKAFLKDEEAKDMDVSKLLFNLEAFSDSDYVGASLDKKSTTGGCQFLGRRLISWQCKKHTIVANSTTKAEYVATANCCGQCFTLKPSTRDSYEKKLIQVIKIHTDHNVADLLTKAFDVSRPIPLITYETVIKEWEDIIERAATTASSLVAEQDSEAQIRFEAASKQSNDPPLSRVNTLGSVEDSMKLKELIEFCTKVSVRDLDL
ncbi:putative ribonuclease H-like domain-containing protein [Tanacetum coccineum]